jgi:hypothetical protein
MMCAVADPKTSEDTRRDGGVLANLPRTRPQRSSPRRTAARGAATSPSRARKASPAKRPQSNNGVASASATAAAAAPDAAPKTKSQVRATRPAAATKRSTAPRRSSARKSGVRVAEEAAPRQGFECDGEASGGSVQPPGGAEFVATAAEIVGELAKAGLSTGERLVKDVLSRLPLS